MGWWRRSSGLRRAGWALFAVALAVLAVMLPMRALGAGDDGFNRIVGWANILGFSVGVAGLLLVVGDRWRSSATLLPEAVDDAAERLHDEVLSQEGQQRARLLGTGRVTTTAANLRYTPDRLVRFHAAGPAATGGTPATAGDLEGIGDFFAEHTDGRLVVLGHPGSGKTVLVLELLIQLLEQRRATGSTRTAVPVRFSLPAWNTDLSLHDWLSSDIATRFGLSDAVAQALVEQRRILPVLDGLDEMDPPAQPPRRADAAVTRLNTYLTGRSGLPLVVTCRIGDYRRLSDVVRPAVEITIQSLTVEQIDDYLDREFGAPFDAIRRQDWRERLAGPDNERLVRVLATPWRLTLAVTYHRGGGDLDELLPNPGEPDPGAAAPDPYERRVTATLLNAFFRARTHLYGADRYTPEQVTDVCRALADHLGAQVDIVLHEIWPMAGRRRVLRWHAWVAFVLSMVAMLLAGVGVNGGMGAAIDNVAYYMRGFPHLQPRYFASGIGFTLLVLLFPYWAIKQAQRPRIEPTRINVQQVRTVRGRHQFVQGMILGLAGGVVIGLVLGLTGNLGGGLSGGLMGGLATGIAVGVMAGLDPIGAAIDPRDPLRNDVIVWLIGVLALGLECAFAFGFGSQLAFGFVDGLMGGVAAGFAIGLAMGLGGNAWLRYRIATALLAHDKRAPLRFGEFLDWAYDAGILRIAGSAYQFRHIELRDWLQHRSAATGEAAVAAVSSPQ